MDVREGSAVEALTRAGMADAPLASLRGETMMHRFHAWTGASGRRYVTSVFAVDWSQRYAGLPDFDGFVLIPVVRRGTLRRPTSIVAVERDSEKQRAIVAALADQATEWHVHLLADRRTDRVAVVADLSGGYATLALTA